MTIPKCHTAPGAAGTAGARYRCESHDEITEAREVKGLVAEVLTAWYEEPVAENDWWRLSCHDWRRVNNLVRLLEAARKPSIPKPRSSADIRPQPHAESTPEVAA